MRTRLQVGAIMLLSWAVLSLIGMHEVNFQQQRSMRLVAEAQAQEKKADPTPAEVKKGIDDLKKDAQAFKRGAIRTPAHKIFAANKFRPTGIRALPQVAYVPKKLSMWGNSTYGDCVSAEEAFNQSVCGAFLDDSVVTGWAGKNGFLNGADLLEVMQAMNKSGMVSGGKTYGVGANPVTVDYSNEATLQAALSIAPVKIGIDANALPNGAGNNQGWYTLATGTFRNEDHCVSLAGYGPANYLFTQLGVPLPAAVTATQPGYLLFTWSTIGFVTHGWLMGTCGEAWLRNPSQTIDGVAQPNPGPIQTVPTITSPLTAAATTGALFTYQIVASNTPTSYAAAGLPAGITCAATTGLISGTPSAAGTFTVTLSATNSSGAGTATLALAVTGAPAPGPNPNPQPVPSGIKIPLSADQVLGLQRDPTNTFEPTTAQVQQVINGAGMEIIDGAMTATDFFAAINRATAKKSKYTIPPKSGLTTEDKIEQLQKDNKRLMEAFMEFMKKESK